MLVAVWCKAHVYCRSLPETAGSNTAGGMAVSLLRVLCVVNYCLCDGPIPPSEES
jgi:hypothetical protein